MKNKTMISISRNKVICIILVIMATKKPEELTIEEIKEQMSLYQRLYHHKMKDTPEYQEARKQSKKRSYSKKKQKGTNKGGWKKAVMNHQRIK